MMPSEDERYCIICFDFYDGPTQGLAFHDRDRSTFFFQCVVWSTDQDDRLYARAEVEKLSNKFFNESVQSLFKDYKSNIIFIDDKKIDDIIRGFAFRSESRFKNSSSYFTSRSISLRLENWVPADENMKRLILKSISSGKAIICNEF